MQFGIYVWNNWEVSRREVYRTPEKKKKISYDIPICRNVVPNFTESLWFFSGDRKGSGVRLQLKSNSVKSKSKSMWIQFRRSKPISVTDVKIFQHNNLICRWNWTKDIQCKRVSSKNWSWPYARSDQVLLFPEKKSDARNIILKVSTHSSMTTKGRVQLMA